MAEIGCASFRVRAHLLGADGILGGIPGPGSGKTGETPTIRRRWRRSRSSPNRREATRVASALSATVDECSRTSEPSAARSLLEPFSGAGDLVRQRCAACAATYVAPSAAFGRFSVAAGGHGLNAIPQASGCSPPHAPTSAHPGRLHSPLRLTAGGTRKPAGAQPRQGHPERSESGACRCSRRDRGLRSSPVPARFHRGCPLDSGSVRCASSSRVHAVHRDNAGHGQR